MSFLEILRDNCIHKQGSNISRCFWLGNQVFPYTIETSVCFIYSFSKSLMSILYILGTVLPSGSSIRTSTQLLPSKSLQSSREDWHLTETQLLENEKCDECSEGKKNRVYMPSLPKIVVDRVPFPSFLIQRCGWEIGSKNITLNLYSCQRYSSFPPEFSSDKMACWEWE